MRYCADTWFILQAFDKNSTAISLITETKTEKTEIIIPMIVFIESYKKLFQCGVARETIELFFAGVEASEKIKLVTLDKAIGKEAAHISLSFHIPLIDALVAATARLTGCEVLLAKDSDYNPLMKRKYIKIKSF